MHGTLQVCGVNPHQPDEWQLVLTPADSLRYKEYHNPDELVTLYRVCHHVRKIISESVRRNRDA